MSDMTETVDLTTLVLEEPAQLTSHLAAVDLAGLTCTSTSMALAVPTMPAAATRNGDDALPTPPFQSRGAPAPAPGTADTALNHAGDPFVYADAAAARAAPARLERRLPRCSWLPQVPPAAAGETPHPKETVALASYPRSGNSMLRGLLERRYGFYTGSDTRPDRTLSRALRDQWGMAGEGVVDPRLVRVVKTHWPERRGWRPVPAHRAVLLVRNPFDAIDSYFNMCLTNTHHLSLTEEVYTKFFETWQAMLRSEARLWRAFHQWWLHQSGVPIFVVRYEDLRADPEATLDALDKWLHGAQAKPPPQPPPPPVTTLQVSASELAEPKLAVLQPQPAPLPPQPAGPAEGPPAAEQAAPGEGNYRSRRLDSSRTASSSSRHEGTPYAPRSAGLGAGKALARCDAKLAAAVVAGAGPAMLKGFGYLPSTQVPSPVPRQAPSPGDQGSSGFSHDGDNAAAQPQPQPPPQRLDYARAKNCRPGKAGVGFVTLNAPCEPELRAASDPFGRYMTVFRKQHTVGDTQPLAVVSGEPYRLATPVYT